MTQDFNKTLDEIKKDCAETKESVKEIVTVLKGYNGFPGLCKSHEDLLTDYHKFKRNVLVVVSILIGSGVLGSGAWALLG
jgi:mRNA-degrading endonuclease YafQ of YafQ-DinJ toxin-antitoxin module